MDEVGRGMKVIDHAPVRGRVQTLSGPTDVVALMDDGASGVVAVIKDAGATFLAPLYHELAAVVCTGGTPRSHIGIVSREFQVPCVMGVTFSAAEPERDAEVEVDCSGDIGIVRA